MMIVHRESGGFAKAEPGGRAILCGWMLHFAESTYNY